VRNIKADHSVPALFTFQLLQPQRLRIDMLIARSILSMSYSFIIICITPAIPNTCSSDCQVATDIGRQQLK
jgi:hypothetical protein